MELMVCYGYLLNTKQTAMQECIELNAATIYSQMYKVNAENNFG